MPFNFLDLLVIAVIVLAARRGRKRGLYVELPGTLSAVLFFISGAGLLKIMYHWVAGTTAWFGISLGIFSFIIFMAGSIYLLIKLRARIRAHAEKRIDERHRETGGAIAGGVRALVWCSVVMIILAHGPLSFMTRGLAQGSLLGSGLIRFVLPTYEKKHHH